MCLRCLISSLFITNHILIGGFCGGRNPAHFVPANPDALERSLLGGVSVGFCVCVCAQAQWCAVPGSAPRLPWIPVITHNSKFLMVADGSGPVKSLAASSTRVSQRNEVVVCQPVLIMWSCSCHLSSRVTHKPKQASLFTTLEPFNSFCLFNYHHSAQILPSNHFSALQNTWVTSELPELFLFIKLNSKAVHLSLVCSSKSWFCLRSRKETCLSLYQI